MLLDFQSNPTRHALLHDIVSRGILNEVVPGLADLYNHLETKFHPLSLAKNITESIALVKATPQLAVYAVPLQRVAVLRVVLQLSRVYSTIKVDFVRSLLAPLSDIPYNQVERVMVDGVSRKQLQLRIDHAAGCLRFGSLVTAGGLVETHVAQFGSTLAKLATVTARAQMDTAAARAAEQSKAQARRAYMQQVAASVEEEHELLLKRKGAIELRKEGLERQLAVTAEKNRITIEEQEVRRMQIEKARLEEEARQREIDNQRKANEKLQVMKLQKDLARYNINLAEEEIAAMDTLARMTLIKEAKATEQKGRDELAKRVSEQARRIDHITRALRIEVGHKPDPSLDTHCPEHLQMPNSTIKTSAPHHIPTSLPSA